MADTPSGPRSDRGRPSQWLSTLRNFVRYTPSGDTIPDETWRGRHGAILVLLVAHVPPLFVLGIYAGTESLVTGARIPAFSLPVVLFGVGVVVGFALLASLPWFGRRVRTGLSTLGLVSASAILVYFSGGYIEAHFHFFVMMAVVAIYEDWLPFVLGIVYVAVQHGYFGMTSPELVYNHPAAIANPLAWAGVHATFVLALAVALMAHWYSTERSREEALEQSQLARSLEEKNEEIEAARAQAEEAKAEAEARQQELGRLNDHLNAKAEAYSDAMARAAEGDLTVRLDPESESEAMTRVAVAFNEMLDETASVMEDIQAFTRDVAAASEEANVGVKEVEGASGEVTDSIQEISSGADEQREMLQEVAGELNDLSATVEEVASSARTVARTSQETAEIVDDGEETAQQAIEDSRAVQDVIDTTVDRMEALDAQMDEIGEVVDLIGDIAKQTNMLALNANIEAARAGAGAGGGDGDGFAVVADEVKQLAEETQASASEIEALIEETQERTEATVREARMADRRMQEGAEAVRAVVDAFTRVADNTEETNSGIQEISGATDDQASSTEEVVSMVDEVTDISQRTADEAEAVSAAAEEQTSSMLQVSSNVGSLAEQAEQLQSLLSSFEVGDAGAPAGRSEVAVDDD